LAARLNECIGRARGDYLARMDADDISYPERFALHNFDVLLSGAEIRASVYRYFFSPPVEADGPMLREVIDAFGRADFYIPVGGLHPLEDFGVAIANSWNRPELGKQILTM